MEILILGSSISERSNCCPAGAFIDCPCRNDTLCRNVCIVDCISFCAVRCGSVCPTQVVPLGT